MPWEWDKILDLIDAKMPSIVRINLLKDAIWYLVSYLNC